MEDSLSLNKSQSFPQNKKSSSKKQGTIEQNTISSKQKKKKSEGSDDLDLTNKILSNLSYENFESENDKFRSHVRKKHEEIYIDNVSLLDQNRFRFLISNNAKIFNYYTTYEKGNFKNINWEDIKLVYYYYVEDYQCPICLENKIVCPMIIKCGHIFCYPCFLNFYNYYTNVSINKKVPNCPLCSEKIDLEKNELKFCEMIRCQNYTNNMNIKFNLIMREKTSPTLFNLFYDPTLKKWKNSLKYQMRSIPLEISKEFLFSRIFSTNKKLTNGRINNLLKELKEEIKEEKEFYADETRINYLNQCIDILNNMLKENNQQKDFILESVFQKENANTNTNNNTSSDNKFDLISNNSSTSNTSNTINENITNNISDNNFTEDGEINYKKYFLFYQEEEGDIYYLHPFIMDILLTEYGDYSNLPVVISGNILDVEMKQVTPYIKSNYPYLSHLYLGSIIFFVEIDVSKLISGSTRKKFSHALNERAKRRRLLSNEEKNYEKFINKKSIKEEEELKNYYLYHNQLRIMKDIEAKKEEKEEKEEKEKKDNEGLNNNNNSNVNDANDENNSNLENKNDENKKEENTDKDKDKEIPKKENMLKKLLEENEKEKEEKEREEKERLERLERERREKEKKESKTFFFDEKDFPELNKKEEKIEKESNVNKGGKKGKKKGKKKFQEIGEDFLKDAFNTNPPAEEEGKENDKKTKGKKSSKNN